MHLHCYAQPCTRRCYEGRQLQRWHKGTPSQDRPKKKRSRRQASQRVSDRLIKQAQSASIDKANHGGEQESCCTMTDIDGPEPRGKNRYCHYYVAVMARAIDRGRIGRQAGRHICAANNCRRKAELGAGWGWGENWTNLGEATCR